MGSEFGAIWEDSEGGFIKFVVKRTSKQDQALHMEGKLHVILYFREVWWELRLSKISGFFLKKFPDYTGSFSAAPFEKTASLHYTIFLVLSHLSQWGIQ